MNIDNRSFAASESLGSTTTDRDSGRVYLPEPIYEALPTLYVSVGTALGLGAAYIGSEHPFMLGYLAAGLSCILAGIRIAGMRRRSRSRTEA